MFEIQGDFNLMLEKSQRKGHLKSKTIFYGQRKKKRMLDMQIILI